MMHGSRRIVRAWGIPLLAVLFALPAAAQFRQRSARPRVSVAPIDTIHVRRGGKAPLFIAMRVNRGFHVNSHQPNDTFLLPTVVHLDPPDGIMIVNIRYPEGEQVRLPFSPKNDSSVYSGEFEVTADVLATRRAAYGTLRVHGEVRYQACDNRECFPPRTTPLAFDVRVVRRRAHHRRYRTPASPHIR